MDFISRAVDVKNFTKKKKKPIDKLIEEKMLPYQVLLME